MNWFARRFMIIKTPEVKDQCFWAFGSGFLGHDQNQPQTQRSGNQA
jgi:hypothetical protein